MAVSEVDYEYVRTLVCQRSAIQLGAEKAYRVEQSLLPLAKAEGFESIGALVSNLRNAVPNGLHRRVVEAMTVNETTFFRDVYPFDTLQREVVPRWMAERSEGKRKLDIWCAACSTGQEPYSVAMLLREQFPALSGSDVKILATDLSSAVLEKAKQGVYGQMEVNRGLPARRLVKHFQRQGMNWRLNDDLPQCRRVPLAQPDRAVAAVVRVRRRLPSERAHLLRHRNPPRNPGAGLPLPASRRSALPRRVRNHDLAHAVLRAGIVRRPLVLPPPNNPIRFLGDSRRLSHSFVRRSAMEFGESEVTQLMEMIWTSVLDWDVRADESAAESFEPDDFVTGTVGISGAWTGSVLLRCHRDVRTEAAVRMFGMPADQLSSDLVSDALGELTNMLAGNLKGLMPGPCRLGLPSVGIGDDFPTPSPDYRTTLQTAYRCDSKPLVVEIREWRPVLEADLFAAAR